MIHHTPPNIKTSKNWQLVQLIATYLHNIIL